MWDQDIFKWNDCIAESTILDLSQCLAEAFRTKGPVHLFPPIKPPPKDGDGKQTFAGAEGMVATAEDAGQEVDVDTETAAGTGAAAGAGAEDADPTNPRRSTVNAPRSHPHFTTPAPQQPAAAGLEGYESDDDEGEIDHVGGVSTSGPKRAKTAATELEDIPGETPAERKKREDEEEAKESVKNMKKAMGIEEDVHPDNAAWLKMYTEFKDGVMCREFAGQVLISVEAVPVEMAKEDLPAGFGRSEPNMNPELPDPVGRMKFSLNPFYLLNEILGPALCRKIMCFIIFVAVVALLIWGGPFLSVVFEVLGNFPVPVQIFVWVLLFLIICGPPCYYNIKASCAPIELSDDTALDLDPELAEPEESKPLLPKEADKAKGTAAGKGGAAAS